MIGTLRPFCAYFVQMMNYGSINKEDDFSFGLSRYYYLISAYGMSGHRSKMKKRYKESIL